MITTKSTYFTYLSKTQDDVGIDGPFVQLDRFRDVESMIGLLRYSYSDPSYSDLKKSWFHNPLLKNLENDPHRILFLGILGIS